MQSERAGARHSNIAPERVLAVIPARLASSRLPEKALQDIAGKPMIARVVEAVCGAARVGGVLVATDDERIAAAARAAGAQACMTRPEHESGSDRIVEAVRVSGRNDVELVLNIQGDEPLIPATAVDRLVSLLEEHPDAGVSTLACPLLAEDPRCEDPNVVKLVMDGAGRALYFSRARIPSRHPDGRPQAGALRHVGLYGFRRPVLERFAQTPPSGLERAEGLEQLRLLHTNVSVCVGVVDDLPGGVDTAEDLERARNLFRSDSGRPS